jgi:hypothetical protein
MSKYVLYAQSKNLHAYQNELCMMYDLELSWRLSIIKFSRDTSHARWLKGEKKTNVSKTISIFVLRVVMWLKFQSVSYIHLPKPHVHSYVLANRNWWEESKQNISCAVSAVMYYPITFQQCALLSRIQ